MSPKYLTDDQGQKVAVADCEVLMGDVADLAAVAERRAEERISFAETQ